MRYGIARAIFVALMGLLLAHCSALNHDPAKNDLAKTPAAEPAPDGTTTLASATAEDQPAASEPGQPTARLLGSDPNDNLSLGKKYFRDGDYGLAEKHFRRAIELHAYSAEAWLGLAASYDRSRRFDLADRAYAQAIRLAGRTVEILNNQGYSYMLRGDYRHAREKLLEADVKSPNNPYVKNNLRLLATSTQRRQAVQ